MYFIGIIKSRHAVCFFKNEVFHKIFVFFSRSVIPFAVFQGDDSRFGLEQNVATAKYLGSQEAEWLYSQTKELNDMGVNVTYSGDQPFLLRLILGISVDYNYNSMAPMYFDDEETDIFAVNPDSRMRSDLNVNFRQSIPKTLLRSFTSDIEQMLR